MKKIICLLLAFFLTLPAWAATNPSATKLKILKAQICTNGDCTGCMTAYVGGNLNTAPYINMLESPTMGSAEIPLGTYNCVIMEMSDQIKITPVANDGNDCVAGVEATPQDVCNTGAPSGILPDGTTVNCAAGEQKVAVYISTWSSRGEGSNSFRPPVAMGDYNLGLALSEPLEVTASTGGAFYLDGTGQVYDAGSTCEMQVPKFGFRKINSLGI